jgi:hypothetical protein
MPVTLLYITSLLLILGALPLPLPLPYAYYELLRFVVTPVAIWTAYIANEKKEIYLMWCYIVVAVIFNPVIKVHLPKELWVAVDIVSCVLLLLTAIRITKQSTETLFKTIY